LTAFAKHSLEIYKFSICLQTAQQIGCRFGKKIRPHRMYFYGDSEVLVSDIEPSPIPERKNYAAPYHLPFLKGPCHDIFDLWFFSTNNSP
jgi:hypothetical protein